jgi:hypothetical protein
VERVTDLAVPWRVLAPRLVTLTDDGKHVLYRHHLRVQLGKDQMPAGQARENIIKTWILMSQIYLLLLFQDSTGITETLYRHKNTLETLFRFMDKDNSGSTTALLFDQVVATN